MATTEEQRERGREAVRRYRARDPEKVRAQARKSVQKWRDANRQKSRDAINPFRERGREIVYEAKCVPCAECGIEWPPVAMDFHHRDPTMKEASISKIYTWSEKRLRAEIAKCDVLCANCHRIRHALEGGDTAVIA